MRISVIGLGYIGLPTAAMFANRGHHVIGIDVDDKKVENVNKGVFSIEEPGLLAFLRDAFNTGNLRASVEIEPCDVFIICVPTPIDDGNKPDLSYVESAGKNIASVLQKGNLVILESTVPPGTTINLLKPILEKSGLTAGKDFDLCHCPERVMPGKILKELTENHRLIGGIDTKSSERAKELYSTFVEGEIYIADPTTAEFTKLAENTFRDVNIALANELAKLCEFYDTNIWTVRKMANNHPRVDIHKPGPGVGGHCLPVDPWFLVNGDSGLINKCREINDGMIKHVEATITANTGQNGVVVILGTAYKANTEDERNSPTMKLLGLLDDFDVRLHDPYVKEHRKSIDEVVKDADTLVLMVDHRDYADIVPANILKLMKGNVIIDTRNFFDPSEWKNAGAKYLLLGAREPKI